MIARLAVRWFGLALLSLASACAVFERGPVQAPAAASPVAAPVPAAAPAVAAAPASTTTTPPPAQNKPATAPASGAPSPTPEKAKAATSPAAKPPAPIASKAPAPPAAKAPAAPQLDLAELEKRLRATSAIGTFTKLALKNQVDDLTDKFKAYHQGRSSAKLQDLRQPYELLIMKVLSLLQDEDPALANDIARSRDALWGILSDKTKFTQI
jgi:hypothetical protein